MTDRYSALVVVLEKDIRSDDAKALIDAVRQLRGVADVRGNVRDMATTIALTRTRIELGIKLAKALQELTDEGT